MINGKLTKTDSTKYAERCDGEGKTKKCYNVTAFDSTWAYVISASETVADLVS